MALITKIQEVKAVMRISNLDLDESIPDIDAAQENRIEPYLGPDFLEELQEAYDDTDNDPETPAAFLRQVITRLQKPLAYFAYHDDLGAIHTRLTDAGVRRATGDNLPAAFKWEYEALKEVLAEKAYQSLESLLKFLDKNEDEAALDTWRESAEYKRRFKFLIKDGATFNDCYSLYQPFRTYHLLFSCMADVENFYINPLIGKEFHESLKTGGPHSYMELEATLYLQAALANLTVAQACSKLPVRITDKGLTVMQSTTDGKDSDRANASIGDIERQRIKAETDGNAYLTKAKKFLNANASEEVFPLYFNSPLYTSPNPKPYNRGNRGRRGFGF